MKLNALLVLIVAIGCIGAGFVVGADASIDAHTYYDVECSYNECIRYNPQNGESWVLACPNSMKSCAWEPLEVRAPSTTGTR
tara:strand:- start:1975 stop:2220 length:246 start_codon:yes stop_codon:yes gene_type:complete